MNQEPRQTVTRKIAQKSAVGWFSLRLLWQTGVQVLITRTTGARTARREVLAALDRPDGKPKFSQATLQSDTSVTWFDYVADLGDGFNATYSIAWLVGRDNLFLSGVGVATAQPVPPDGLSEAKPDTWPKGALVLPAGQIAVFGGDQVYPYATAADYEDRTIDPYFAARPWDRSPDRPRGRTLFALPGNHDWYDGLNAFVRYFCQPGRWMGAWQVQQRRSYFAQPLGHGFWLWGVDLATEDDFDAPQMEYFKAAATDLGPGDQVILCVPKPSWIDRDSEVLKQHAAENTRDPWHKTQIIESYVVNSSDQSGTLNGARVPVVLSGDLHHYSRYTIAAKDKRDDRHYITCGGGGAFLLGTSGLPATLRLENDEIARQQALFPTEAQSDAMRNGVFKFFFRHGRFCAALGAVMLALIWFLHATSDGLTGSTLLQSTRTFFSGKGDALDVWNALVRSLIGNPALVALLFGVGAGFVMFADGARALGHAKREAVLVGLVHFVWQLLAALYVATWVHALLAPLSNLALLHGILMVVFSVAVGTLICGLLFSIVLFLSNRLFAMHQQEVFSSQSIEDWKCFLRIRVSAKGVDIYPIGLRQIGRAWVAAIPEQTNDAKKNGIMERLKKPFGDAPQYDVPEGATCLLHPKTALLPELIEDPIHIPSKRGVTV